MALGFRLEAARPGTRIIYSQQELRDCRARYTFADPQTEVFIPSPVPDVHLMIQALIYEPAQRPEAVRDLEMRGIDRAPNEGLLTVSLLNDGETLSAFGYFNDDRLSTVLQPGQVIHLPSSVDRPFLWAGHVDPEVELRNAQAALLHRSYGHEAPPLTLPWSGLAQQLAQALHGLRHRPAPSHPDTSPSTYPLPY